MCGMEPAGQQQASSVLVAELRCLLPRSTERQPGQVLLVEWRHLGSRNPSLVALRSITGHVHVCSYSYTAHRFGAAIKSPCMTSATGHAQSGTVQRAAGPAERGAASTWGNFKTGTAGDRAGAGRAAHLHNPNHCAVVGGPVGQQPGCSATGEDVHAAAGQAHPHALLHPCRTADARTHVLTAPPCTAAINGGSLRAEAQSVVRKSFQHDIRSKLPAEQVYSSIVRDHSSQSRAREPSTSATVHETRTAGGNQSCKRQSSARAQSAGICNLGDVHRLCGTGTDQLPWQAEQNTCMCTALHHDCLRPTAARTRPLNIKLPSDTTSEYIQWTGLAQRRWADRQV